MTAYLSGEWRTISDQDLKERFIEICEAHRAQGRALAFGFILFDRSHPYVRRVLSDQRYWDALDQRAGRHLSVFSLDARPAEAQTGQTISWMYKVPRTSKEVHYDPLRELFGRDTLESLPCVVFFQVQGDELIGSVAVGIEDAGSEKTYAEILSVVGAAADSVAKVSDENASNAYEVFNLIRSGLNAHAAKKRAVRIAELVPPVATVGGALGLLWRIIAAVS